MGLRKQLLKNAYLLLFLSQGVPLLMAGDEFGNSQDGNNNAYCQDNAVSWLNWKLLETHKDQVEFVKRLIAFRKSHKMFHMDREPRIMDYKFCGRPDVPTTGKTPGSRNLRTSAASSASSTGAPTQNARTEPMMRTSMLPTTCTGNLICSDCRICRKARDGA